MENNVSVAYHKTQKGDSYDLRGYDLYETPPSVVKSLLSVKSLPKKIWEPACGPGSIVNTLRSAGHTVFASDLCDWKCPNSFEFDFLKTQQSPPFYDCIVTNPPFMKNMPTKFIEHSLNLVTESYFLLRLTYLEGTSRSHLLESGHLKEVWVFRNRVPRMHRHNWQGSRASNTTAYAWYYFDTQYQGVPTLKWLTCLKE